MPTTADAAPEFSLVIPSDEPFASAILDRLSALMPGKTPVIHHDLAQAAQQDETTMLLLVICHPVEALARRLAAADTPHQALEDWQTATESVLAATRPLRRRLWLLDARGLIEGNPDTLALFEAADKAHLPGDVPARPDPVFLVLAEALLAHSAMADRLVNEIGALRRGGGGDPVTASLCETALTDHARLLNERNLLSSHVSLYLSETERVMADGENRVNVSDFTAVETERDELRDAIARMTAIIDRAREVQDTSGLDIAALKAAAADRHLQKAKSEALQRRLEQAEERAALREAIFGTVLLDDQKSHAIALTDDHRNRIAELERELQSVYGSKSWKLTGPLRAMRKPRPA
ncbi:MAG: hypothetical protein ACK4MS_15070 [Paracoccaceae bacterium]